MHGLGRNYVVPIMPWAPFISGFIDGERYVVLVFRGVYHMASRVMVWQLNSIGKSGIKT